MIAAGAIALASDGDMVLAPGAVRIPLRVWDEGRGRRFALTLMTKPWPLAGDRVRLDFEDLHLRGVVDQTWGQTFDASTRVIYHVSGRVVTFEAKAVYPGVKF